MANDLQRTREWYLARKGKITASECYVLLNNSKVAMTEDELAEWKKANPKSRVTTKEVPFSSGTYTYLDEKIAEMYMPENSFIEYMEECKFETKAMQWGTFWEEGARNRYKEATGFEILDAPFIALKEFENFAGGSPDGVIRLCEENNGTNGIIEIKCPFNPAVHMRHFLFEKLEDLKEDNLQYYVQCQYNMICVEREFGYNVDFCDFISYDPRTSKSKQLKVLRIPAEKEMQKLLLERTKLGVDYLREQINRINNMPSIINEYK